MEADNPELTRTERLALGILRLTNEQRLPKALQRQWLERVSQSWIRYTVRYRTLLSGFEHVRGLDPDRGVVVAANHRSFFDQYVAMLAMKQMRIPWARDLYFPVRSNFFYESPLGILVNLFVGGGSMYPPIFRDPSKASLNKQGLERLSQLLQDRGTVVGVHPEGTRGKGPDPYELLPAQPGIGQIILQSRAIVLPLFINGITNDLLAETRFNYRRPECRRERPAIMVWGPPVDYSEYAAKKPRASLYKRTSDRVLETIRGLSEIEKRLRAQCESGEIADDDPRWLENAPRP